MPQMRHTYLREADTWTAATTYREDLPKTGFLSAILLEAQASMVSGGTLATESWRLVDWISKVEVRGDSADIVTSCDWIDLSYLGFLDQLKMPPHFWRNYASSSSYEYALIPFGRYIGDPEYGLDLSKWDRADLRLTNSITSTYFSGNITLDVILLMLDDLPGGFPGGYRRIEEFRKWTTAQNTWEYVELPTAHPLRGVHLQCRPAVDSTTKKANTGMANLADDVKFAIGDRRRYLFDGGIDHLMARNYFEFPGLPQTYTFTDRTADRAFRVDIGRVFGAATASGSKDGAVSSNVPTIEGDSQNNTQALEDREADSPVHGMWTGMAPFMFVSFLHERECRPDWMLDPARVGLVTLDVHTRDSSSAASGTNRVLLDSIVAGR